MGDDKIEKFGMFLLVIGGIGMFVLACVVFFLVGAEDYVKRSANSKCEDILGEGWQRDRDRDCGRAMEGKIVCVKYNYSLKGLVQGFKCETLDYSGFFGRFVDCRNKAYC